MAHFASEMSVSDGVSRLWPTTIALAHVPVESHLATDIPAVDQLAGTSASDAISISQVVQDPEGLASLFVRSMQDLDLAGTSFAAEGAIERANLRAEVWGPGFAQPILTSPARYLGWYVLASSRSEHVDSGTICVMDPRAGCDRTAVPGLPWGRHLMVSPKAGSFLVIPGWLTSSVLPFERDQFALVISASSGE